MSAQLIPVEPKKGRRLSLRPKLQLLKEWEPPAMASKWPKSIKFILTDPLYPWKKVSGTESTALCEREKATPRPAIRKFEKKNQKLKEAFTLQTQELMLF